MSTATYLRTRVDPSPAFAGLAVGDVLAIALFAAAGVDHHGGNPLDAMDVLETAAPFLLAWLAVALLGGLYTVDAVSSPRRAISWAVPAWVLAALVGAALRATALFSGGVQWTFVLVTVGAGGALVVGWRLVASLLW